VFVGKKEKKEKKMGYDDMIKESDDKMMVAGRHECVGIIIALAFARRHAQVRRRTYKCIHTGTRIYIHIYILYACIYTT